MDKLTSNHEQGEEDPDQDFLLGHTRVTLVQFIGLWLIGLSGIFAGITIWGLFIFEHLGSRQFLDVMLVVFGSGVCAFFVYFGFVVIRRAFRS